MGYLSISIEGPSSAQEGERIELDFRVVNPHPVIYPILLYGYIDDIDNSVGLPGDVIQFPANTERVYERARTMPGHSITVYVELYVEDPLMPGGWLLDDSDSLSISLAEPPPPPPPVYSLTTGVVGLGSVFPSSGLYEEGMQVTLVATPGSGYVFSHWSGDASGSNSSVTVTMNRDRHIVANFTEEAPPPPPPPTYYLTTAVVGSGSVFPSSGLYEEGMQVTLVATPGSGYVFSHWSGDASGSNSSVTVTMNRDRHIVANFTEEAPPPPPVAGAISTKELEYNESQGAIPVSDVPQDKSGLVHIWGRNDTSVAQRMGIYWFVADPDGLVVEEYSAWEAWPYTSPGDDHEFIGGRFDLSKVGKYTMWVDLLMNPDAPEVVDTYVGDLCTVAPAPPPEEFTVLLHAPTIDGQVIGTVSKEPDLPSYSAGDGVVFTATLYPENEGEYTFDHWLILSGVYTYERTQNPLGWIVSNNIEAYAFYTAVPAPPPPEEFAGTISRKELEYDETRRDIPVL